jgi:hypothetical protein
VRSWCRSAGTAIGQMRRGAPPISSPGAQGDAARSQRQEGQPTTAAGKAILGTNKTHCSFTYVPHTENQFAHRICRLATLSYRKSTREINKAFLVNRRLRLLKDAISSSVFYIINTFNISSPDPFLLPLQYLQAVSDS